MTNSSLITNLRDLLVEHGREEAKMRVDPPDRHLVDIAARMLASEEDGFGVAHAAFCQASLPHRRLPNDQDWVRSTENIRLLIEPGKILRPTSDVGDFIGVPFGSRARLILLYLQTQAKKTGSPEIELGRSMYAWLKRMGLTISGQAYKDVSEQAMRLSTCRLTFFEKWKEGQGTAFESQKIIDGGILFIDHRAGDEKQGTLFVETVRLSKPFFDDLMQRAVPFQETAIRQIQNNSMALDIYVWLAHKLHALANSERRRGVLKIHWPMLHAQFGGGYKHLRQFKPNFIENLKLALAVYPEAKVDLLNDGLVLYASPPPVAPITASTKKWPSPTLIINQSKRQ
jgi:hypothetical protein